MSKPCDKMQDINKGTWSKEEDTRLINYVTTHGEDKGTWSKEEDTRLINYVTTHGEGCCRTLPQAAGLLRCGKSCRQRWFNYLRPDVKKGNFGEDEDDLIIRLHALLGNRWSLIAGRLPGRTDNEIKNYWNSHLRKNLVEMGIDPDNHRLPQSFLGSRVTKSLVGNEQLHSGGNGSSNEDGQCSSSGPVMT